MSDIIDLDALVPQDVVVKFGGEEISIQPPKTADVLKLGYLGQKLQEGSSLTDAELDKLILELTTKIKNCVPQLADKDLNTAQLLKLVDIISTMAMPPDTKELAKRGISTTSPKAP